MTHPNLSWTSRQEARRLLDELRAPVTAGAGAPAQPAPAPESTYVTLTLSSPPPAPEEPELRLSGGIFERVRAYCEWAHRTTGAISVFLADENGLMVHGVGAEAGHVAVMAPLLGAMEQMRKALGGAASRGAVTVRPEEVLNFAETATPLGRYSVGLLHRDFLGDAQLARLQVALVHTLEESAHG